MAITRLEFVEVVRKEQREMSLRSFAAKLGVSAAYLSDFYRGRRDAGPLLLKRFGYRRVKTVTVLYLKSKGES